MAQEEDPEKLKKWEAERRDTESKQAPHTKMWEKA
jgi:hypothetical protein